jgi:hypothetical protein
VIVPKFRWALVNKVPGPELHWFFGSLQKYYSGNIDAANMLPEDVNYMLYATTTMSSSIVSNYYDQQYCLIGAMTMMPATDCSCA